jgi:alginate O-acetyltransferase complex protein AlgI
MRYIINLSQSTAAMLYLSIEFALFFLTVFALYWGTRRSRTASKLVLLSASYVFYATWGIDFLLILIGFSCWIDFIGGRISAASNLHAKRAWLALGVAVAIGNLAIFKYLAFLLDQLEPLVRIAMPEVQLPALSVLMPVGISFYTLQGLTYLFSLYRGELAQSCHIDVFLFVAFFPSLLSGPISRASGLIPQLAAAGTEGMVEPEAALALVVSGLFKKIVLSSYFSMHVVDPVFSSPEDYGTIGTVFAMYGYAQQIYCDFSGYTDVVTGIAMLLGYRLPLNFNAPYLAWNVKEFWRRWHISLSSWIRDYVYIPLGGNRKGSVRTALNIMAAMVLSGLWHGANTKYLIWGGLHGLGAVSVHVWQALFRPNRGTGHPLWQPITRFVGWILTFHFICAAWVFFRADSLDTALALFSNLGPVTIHWSEFSALAAGTILFVLLMQSYGGELGRAYAGFLRRQPLMFKPISLAATVFIMLQLGPEGIPPFIYFQY